MSVRLLDVNFFYLDILMQNKMFYFASNLTCFWIKYW